LATAAFHLNIDVSTRIGGVLTNDQRSKINAAVESINPEPSKAESNEAIKKIIQIAINLESEGKITLSRSDSSSSQQPDVQTPESQQLEVSSPESSGEPDSPESSGEPDSPESTSEEAGMATEADIQILAKQIKNGSIGSDRAWMIVASVDPILSGRILEKLDTAKQYDIILSIILSPPITQQTLDAIEGELSEYYRNALKLRTPDLSKEALAGKILSNTRASVRDALLMQLNSDSPIALEMVRKEMLLFNDLSKVSDKDFRNIMRRTMSDGTLQNALTAYSRLMQDKVLNNLELEDRQRFLADVDARKGLQETDSEKARIDVVNIALALELEGVIKIPRSNDSEAEFE
jgi:flagellar motor switch protein FliG